MAAPSVQCLNPSRFTGGGQTCHFAPDRVERKHCETQALFGNSDQTHSSTTSPADFATCLTWYCSCPLRLVEAQARYCTSFLGLSTWFQNMMRQFCRLLVTTFFVDISCVTFSPQRQNERPRAKKVFSTASTADMSLPFVKEVPR